MKALLISLLVVLVAAPIVGCQKDEKKRSSIRTNRERRGESEFVDPNTGQVIQNNSDRKFQPVNGKVWGEVTGSPQDTFQKLVENLLSAQVPMEDVGLVSGSSNGSTGVRFWGHAELASGSFNSNGNTSGNISLGNAEIRISIWDDKAGGKDSNGNTIPEFPIHIRGATEGWVSGNRIYIKFEDSYGFVVIDGNYSSGSYQGQISFDNFTNVYDDEQGAAGTLGNFYISTCGFMRCN